MVGVLWVSCFQGQLLLPLDSFKMLFQIHAEPSARCDPLWAEYLSEEFLKNLPNKEDLRQSVLALWRLKRVGEAGETDVNWQKYIAAWMVRSPGFFFIPVHRPLFQKDKHYSLCVAAGVRPFKIILDFRDELIISATVSEEWFAEPPVVDWEPALASKKKRKVSVPDDGDFLKIFDSQDARTPGLSTDRAPTPSTLKTTPGKKILTSVNAPPVETPSQSTKKMRAKEQMTRKQKRLRTVSPGSEDPPISTVGSALGPSTSASGVVSSADALSSLANVGNLAEALRRSEGSAKALSSRLAEVKEVRDRAALPCALINGQMETIKKLIVEYEGKLSSMGGEGIGPVRN